jgi:hypothetical protein
MDILQENTRNEYINITNNTVALVSTVSTIIVQDSQFGFTLSLNSNPKITLQNSSQSIFSIIT